MGLSCEQQQADPIIENTMYNASSKPAILEFPSAKINACTFFRYYGKQGLFTVLIVTTLWPINERSTLLLVWQMVDRQPM